MADGMATRPEAPRRSLARTPTQVQVPAQDQARAQAQARAQMPSQTRAPVQARAPTQVQVPAQARARVRVRAQARVRVRVRVRHPEHCNPKQRTSSRRATQKSGRRPYPHRPIRLHSVQPNSQRHGA